jgi:putative N6-adenine-specific DNA methylase
MPNDATLRLFLPCAAGVEGWLTDEVRRLLGAAQLQSRRGGVWLATDSEGLMRLHLGSRLAQRVLIEVAEGDYRDEADLYALARSVDWSGWITPQHSLRVDTTAMRSPLRSLNFAALRIKDAVCDQLRERENTHSATLVCVRTTPGRSTRRRFGSSTTPTRFQSAS